MKLIKFILQLQEGLFLNYKHNQFKKIKPIHAIKHPKWKMGKKFQ